VNFVLANNPHLESEIFQLSWLMLWFSVGEETAKITTFFIREIVSLQPADLFHLALIILEINLILLIT
jgi:hypothetical protein